MQNRVGEIVVRFFALVAGSLGREASPQGLASDPGAAPFCCLPLLLDGPGEAILAT